MQDQSSKQRAFFGSLNVGLLAAVLYGFVSGAMAFMNKNVVTTLKFPHPVVLVLIQMIMTLFGLKLLEYIGQIELSKYTLEKPERLAKTDLMYLLFVLIDARHDKRGRILFIPAACYTINATAAIGALEDLNIPMYSVLKRTGPLVTLILSVIVLSKKPSVLVCISVLLMVSGCILAGIHNLSSHVVGLIAALVSVISQGVYLIYLEKTGANGNLSAASLLYINTINCLPIQLFLGFITRDIQTAAKYPNLGDWQFQLVFFTTVGMGVLLNYLIFLCTYLNSALTTSIVGVIKGLLTTVIGFFTFGGVPATAFTVFAVSLNMFGGIMYAYAKYQDKQKQHIQKNDPI